MSWLAFLADSASRCTVKEILAFRSPLRNFHRVRSILFSERPQVIVSNGLGVSEMFCRAQALARNVLVRCRTLQQVAYGDEAPQSLKRV